MYCLSGCTPAQEWKVEPSGLRSSLGFSLREGWIHIMRDSIALQRGQARIGKRARTVNCKWLHGSSSDLCVFLSFGSFCHDRASLNIQNTVSGIILADLADHCAQ